MELHVHHISGSKAGLQQTFRGGTVRIGREPSNDVAFDPYQDILVSARHAEITFDGRHWILRDLNSSNGTFVGDERVKERALASGETIQFGRGGPRLQLKFEGAPVTRSEARVDNPGTHVMSVEDLVGGRKTTGGRVATPAAAAPVADGTVMMNVSEARDARAHAGAVAPPSARRTSPLRVVLLVALLAFFVGIMGIVLLNPGPKKKAAPANREAQAEIEKLKADLAAREAQLRELEQLRRNQNPTTDAVVTQDLERQYHSAQSTIDALREELERKNDEVRAAEEKPPQVVYVKVPVREERPASPGTQAITTPAPAPAPAAQYEPAAQPATQSQPAMQQVARAVPPPAATHAPPVYEPAPAPRSTTLATPPPVSVSRTTPTIAPPLQTPAAEIPPMKLAKWKRLKRRVVVSGVTSEIPLPDAPRNLPSELAKSVGAALASSSEYYVDRNSGSTIRITPTLFRSIEKKSDSSTVVNTIKGLGSIFGKSAGARVPVRAQSASYDAALAVEVTVESSSGRVLARSTPSSTLVDRRSSVSIVPAKASFGDLLNNDTPISDVIRNVVAQAADEAMRALASAEPEIGIKSVRGAVVTLDAGRNASIAPDDVFDIVQGSDAVARIHIESVQDGTAIGRFVGPSAVVTGAKAVYVGVNESSASAMTMRTNVRAATIRVQTEGKEAPGKSFSTVMALRPGIRTTYLYSVGSWSKVRNGEVTLWVPTNTIEVN